MWLDFNKTWHGCSLWPQDEILKKIGVLGKKIDWKD